jgi:transketolase
VSFGTAEVVKQGEQATVIAVGPILEAVIDACKELDVTILYYTTVIPFDADTLKNNAVSSKIILCEPYYRGVLASEILAAMKPRPITLECIGVEHKMLTNYGLAAEHDDCLGLTADKIREKIVRCIYE